ncbi:MAG TPA: phosphoglycerate dehydrogenase [Elusimicrobia bacterium]|nr:MAG: phosphoglycerate dehydrogenase [Elusimicrobia bacterium RIFOXYD2_FULL_34_30]HAM37782.1 phosphoglycerate dehydrogenase [Elusimicrobiota bacterium]
MYKVLVSDPLAKEGVEILEKNNEFSVTVKTGMKPDELKSMISEFDGLLVRSETKVTKEILDVAEKLKIIGRAGTGVDNIDTKEASKKGIVVMNVPGGNTISAAEHAVSMLLALSRNIPQANASLKKKEWKKKEFVGVEVFGKTVGVVGLGKIGLEVAKRLLSFGIKVLVYDPFVSKERAMQLGVETVSLDELFKNSDYITIHTPKTEATKNMVNSETIKKMKDGVRIVNCARGGLIDEQALAEALKSGKVKGAALDVFEKEPLTESPFFEMNNVIMTPHLGASTEEAQTSVSVEIVKQLVEYFTNGTIRNAVNFPYIPSDVFQKMQPYILLSEKLGSFSSQMMQGRILSVGIGYSGEATKYDLSPITIAAVKGMLDPVSEEGTINFINASYIAQEKGIKISESRVPDVSDFTNLISVKLKTENGESVISGTVFGKSDIRIVKINDYYVDVEITENILIFTNADKPGVIGKVGTILGKNSINIAAMEVGRKQVGGDAITIVNVDLSIPDKVLSEIKEQSEIKNVKMIKL